MMLQSLVTALKKRLVLLPGDEQNTLLVDMSRHTEATEDKYAAIAILRERRILDPLGKFNRNGTWYPSEEEKCACCSRVRTPSRAYPYSLMTHCRTVKHVEMLYQKQLVK